MGRPQKEGFGYFPLDTNFFYASKKVKALRRAHGAVGLITYINVLCRVYAAGYFLEVDSIDDLARDIAEDVVSEREQIRHIAAKVAETLHYMAEIDLIDRGLFEMNVISGSAIQEQFAESVRKAKRNTKIDSYNLVGVNVVAPENGVSSEEMAVSSEETRVSSEFSTQSKVKENKYTTTTTVRARTCARKAVETVENPPMMSEVFMYFKDKDVDGASNESAAFYAYNAKRGWDCLPDWKLAADLWVARIECPKG